QNRQRVACSLISAPHMGQVLSPETGRPAGGPSLTGAVGASAGGSGSLGQDDSTSFASRLRSGTGTDSPHPGQLARTPALSSAVLSSFWQCGQWNSIVTRSGPPVSIRSRSTEVKTNGHAVCRGDAARASAAIAEVPSARVNPLTQAD